MAITEAKAIGAFYTPENVARALVHWVVRKSNDRLLDPSCGDGQFLSHHPKSIGIEQDHYAAVAASSRAPGSLVHIEDFFRYAESTIERFECAAGNPPFIRYQQFAGEARARALALCRRLGADFSALTSSWAPFLVATASLLKPGGRIAFVVPAEIGHAPYAVPLLKFLTQSFENVHLVAIRESVFPELSQDVWLLYASGYGGRTGAIDLTAWDSFRPTVKPPKTHVQISLGEWREWGFRIRPFLLPDAGRQLYRELSQSSQVLRLGDAAHVGIGYVTGANDFFHFRPSHAKSIGVPDSLLIPTVRNGRLLPRDAVTMKHLTGWVNKDEPCYLLRLTERSELPLAVRRYLSSAAAQKAKATYKCRNRSPWYAVPDVVIPDGFLTYMAGSGPSLVENKANCSCTNSVHAVRLRPGYNFTQLRRWWATPLTTLSAELEGHPLGGGMLKLEPREALRLALSKKELNLQKRQLAELNDSTIIMRQWRHYG